MGGCEGERGVVSGLPARKLAGTVPSEAWNGVCCQEKSEKLSEVVTKLLQMGGLRCGP